MQIQRAHDWCPGTLLRRLVSASDKLYRVFPGVYAWPSGEFAMFHHLIELPTYLVSSLFILRIRRGLSHIADYPDDCF
jgi:hypothetical protein